MKFRKIAAGLAALGLMMTFATANAAVQTVDLLFTGTPQGTVAGEVTVGGAKTNVQAGQFRFDVVSATPGAPVNLNDSLLAYCAEANIRLTTGQVVTYTIVDPMTIYSVGTMENVSRLYTGFYNASRTSAVNSAAFQLALWEILKEADGTALNLSMNFFQALAGTSDWNTAVQTATNWLGGLSSFSASRQFLLLMSDTSQDLVFIPVPEPGVLLLLGTGLLLGGAIRRRTRR